MWTQLGCWPSRAGRGARSDRGGRCRRRCRRACNKGITTACKATRKLPSSSIPRRVGESSPWVALSVWGGLRGRRRKGWLEGVTVRRGRGWGWGKGGRVRLCDDGRGVSRKSYNNNTPRPGVFQRTTIDGVELQNLCSAPLCAAMFPPDSDQPDLDTNETRVDQIPEIPQTVLDTLGVPA